MRSLKSGLVLDWNRWLECVHVLILLYVWPCIIVWCVFYNLVNFFIHCLLDDDNCLCATLKWMGNVKAPIGFSFHFSLRSANFSWYCIIKYNRHSRDYYSCGWIRIWMNFNKVMFTWVEFVSVLLWHGLLAAFTNLVKLKCMTWQ